MSRLLDESFEAMRKLFGTLILSLDTFFSSISPLVLIPRYPALYMISLLLQALFNAKPVRYAFLQLSPPDLRITESHTEESSLIDYWRGNSPNGVARMNDRNWTGLSPRYVDSVDSQYLFSYLF